MQTETAQKLSEMTSQFYAEVAPSFSATRDAPWDGWQRVMATCSVASEEPVRVLDLACGNLRFERFLSNQQVMADVYAYDNCDDLVRESRVERLSGVTVRYKHLDVAQVLRGRQDLSNLLEVPPCNLCACFGFMHHLPLPEQREQVLQALVSRAAVGGIIAVSFWKLSNSDRLLQKARQTTEVEALRHGFTDLGSGDYLLGWQDRADVLRFCHDFSEPEIDALAAAVRPLAEEVSRFSADGKTGDLNRYLILRKA